MASLVPIIVKSVNGIFSSVREYLLGSGEDVCQEESIENDGNAGNDHDDLNNDNGKPVLNIHLQSNTGTVIIGDNSSVKIVDAVSEKVENEQMLTLVSTKANLLKTEPTVVNLDKVNRTKRRRKKASEKDIAPAKVPSIVRRINEIDKSLSKFRGNGEWLAHDDAVKRFLNQFKGDEDNYDILILLKYERAAAFYEKNQIETARQLVIEVSKEINMNERSNWEKINDTRKNIYCKSLLLVVKIYCIKPKFGKARKALDLASDLISGQLKDVELEAELYLVYAWYQFCFSKSHCTSNSVNQVIDYTNTALDISDRFRDRSPDKWEDMRRELLLLRCRAIIQFYLGSEEKEEFSDVLKNSLEELEHQLWNGISLKQKIDFHVLKSDYFNIHGNLAKALDHVQDAIQIAQKREFNEDVLQLLNDRIRKLQTFPGEAAGDSDRLLKRVLDIQTTTDGNLESNASEVAECGIFSTDESDWDTFLEQGGRINVHQIEAEFEILDEM